MSNARVYFWAAVLCLAGMALCAYKVTVLGLPLTPNAQGAVWIVEARAKFQARGNVKASLALPTAPLGYELLDEQFISREFGLAVQEKNDRRRALWSIRRTHGPQTLYYQATLRKLGQQSAERESSPEYPERPQYSEQMGPAIETLLSQVRAQSADIASFARQLIIHMNQSVNDPSVKVLRENASTNEAFVEQLVYILAGARIPARVVYGLNLSHGLLEGELEPWLEVHNEKRWIAFNPQSGEIGFPENLLIWQRHGEQTLQVEGGNSEELRFSARYDLRDAVDLARSTAALHDSRAIEFSLLGLPLHVQNVYAILLTVPLGAFLVVILRNVVGIATFGTFMPVLIALAFRETDLIWGMILFSTLVALGLGIRFYLEHLKLLLVPRLASVLIIVILLMLIISVISHQLDLSRGLSVALFPMVILAMTIERMSIVWEEHGGREAVLRGLGSLSVAVLAFLTMSHDLLEHLVFVFPELLLLVLAATLALGRYTGYRLTEFWRFRAALKPPSGETAK